MFTIIEDQRSSWTVAEHSSQCIRIQTSGGKATLDCLEFVMTDVDQWGMRELHGLARVEPGALVLEFRTHVLGLFRTGLKEVRLPLSDIVEVSFDYRLLYTLIRIRPRSLKAIIEIPGVKGASLKLRVNGIDSRRIARWFVSEVNYQQAILPSKDEGKGAMPAPMPDSTAEIPAYPAQSPPPDQPTLKNSGDSAHPVV